MAPNELSVGPVITGQYVAATLWLQGDGKFKPVGLGLQARPALAITMGWGGLDELEGIAA